MLVRADMTIDSGTSSSETSSKRPLIGITMGDPAGIGPEIVVKALADPEIRSLARFVIFGLHETLTYAADRAEIDCYWWRFQHDHLYNLTNNVTVADYDELYEIAEPKPRANRLSGQASLSFLQGAIEFARKKRLAAIVTGPICKESWKLAKCRFAGHTELLAHAFRAKEVAMMFAGGPLRVVLATIHVPLFGVRHRFTIGRIFHPISLLDRALRNWFGIAEPRIAVASLNPHAGENGQFGDEEKRIIKPAILMAGEAGVNCTGPLPADSVFNMALDGKFDGVVAMYHDQGLIPIKLLSRDEAVNITLGLPVIRTSVDHGTAFDIAGKNIARVEPMKNAIRMAVRLARTQSALVRAEK